MSRLFRYYQERANEVAFLGGMVNILAIVGIGINIHDMKETQKMEQMLLSKQWVSTAAEEVQFSGKVGCFFKVKWFISSSRWSSLYYPMHDHP